MLASAIVLMPVHAESIKDLVGSTITEVVREASIIARVEIVNRTPVWADGLVEAGDSLALGNMCGYYYEARIVESYKGNEKIFSFFSSLDSEFRGLNKEYLIFAYHRNSGDIRESAIRLSDMILSEEESEKVDMACKSFGDYYLPVKNQMLFPFDVEAPKIFGGEWLESFRRPTFLFCGGSPTGKFIEKLKDPQDQSSAVIGWSGIKDIIMSAIKNRYKFWLSDLEKLQGC